MHMKTRIVAIAACSVLTMSSVVAQNAKTGRLAVQAAAAALGAGSLRSIQYSGAGWVAAVGQSVSIDADWPRAEMPAYSRVIDYQSTFSREQWTERQSGAAPRGGRSADGRKQEWVVSGEYGWNVEDNVDVPAVDDAERRRLDLLMSPHGFLKAAADASARGLSLIVEGKKVTIVTFRALGKYTVNGTINEQNLVERVQTWVPDPVLGDMLYEHQYSDYAQFGAVKFPKTIRSFQGELDGTLTNRKMPSCNRHRVCQRPGLVQSFVARGLLAAAEDLSRDLAQVRIAAWRRLEGLERPVLAALHQQHVDQRHDTALAEARELGQHLPRERRRLEPDHQHLDRPAHCSTRARSSPNSSCVSTPVSSRCCSAASWSARDRTGA